MKKFVNPKKAISAWLEKQVSQVLELSYQVYCDEFAHLESGYYDQVLLTREQFGEAVLNKMKAEKGE